MNLRNFFRQVAVCSCGFLLFSLVVGTAVPHIAFAQTSDTTAGEGTTNTTGTTGSTWSNLLNMFTGGSNPTTPAPTTNGGSSGSWTNLFGFGGSNNNSNPAPTQSGSSNNGGGFTLGSLSGLFGGTPGQTGTGGTSNNGSDGSLIGMVWDTVLDPIASVFSNSYTHAIADFGEAVIAEIITNAENFMHGGVTGDPVGGNAIGGDGPVDLTPGGDSGTQEGDTESAGNSNSNSGNGNAGNSGGNSGSYQGARGTVGNPFSRGESSGESTDNNESNDSPTQSNPYLFEYDPSSTNNNPAGDGAMEN